MKPLLKLSTFAICLFGFLLFNLLSSVSAQALTVTANPISTYSNPLSFNLTPGTFNKVSQTITVDNTNYHSGYTMTLETTGYSYADAGIVQINTNSLVNITNPEDTTKRIPTLSSTITSPNDFNNNWGYSFFNTNVAVDDPLRNTFYPVPGFSTGTNPQPIQNTLVSTTTSSTTPDVYELSFGAKVDTSIPAGNYRNNIVVRVVSNPTTCSGGQICYDDNDANSNTTMGNQTISSSATDATLWASNFKRSGYGFAGWNTKADGTGTSYGPNQTITDTAVIDEIKNSGLILYAIWIQSAGNLQSWTPASCNAMNIGDTTALTDTRDGNTYTIAKLADGKCWMVENLRLSNTHTTTGQAVTISSTNTNNPASGFALNAPQDPTSSPWCTNIDAACIDQSRHAANNITSTVLTMAGPNSNVYSYGNYYNWYTATAGNGTYSTSTNNASTAGDICPAGWHLPTGSSSGEYKALNDALGGDTSATGSRTLRSFPNNFAYSGFVGGSSLGSRASGGNFWSSTAQDIGTAYGLSFYSSGVNPGGGSAKFYGYSVRCLLSTTYTINFDSNGGSGNMNPQTATAGQATNLSANTFTAPTNKVFNGWNTDPNGNGTSYTNEQQVTDIASAGGSITLYAQWAPIITYNPNGASAEGTTASPSMGNQSIDQSATDITLWPSNFKRPGYGFVGWNTQADGNGVSYGPNQTITDAATLNSIKNNSLTLYAIWKPSQGNLQSWGQSSCSAMNIGDTTALTDTRDGNTYAIAKLADGKCWMIENLRLDNTAELTTTNTNNPLASSGTVTIKNNDGSTTNHLSPNSNDWCNISDDACISQSNLNTNNTTNTTPIMTTPTSTVDYSDNVYSYGNYYNWYSATAGHGTYSMDSGNTAGDICPAGWHLPTSDTGGEYSALDIAMGGTGEPPADPSAGAEASKKWRSFPNNFIYSGNWWRGVANIQRGMYWSSTAKNNNGTRGLLLSSQGVTLGTGDYNYLSKYEAYSVRCIFSANPNPNTISYDPNGATAEGTTASPSMGDQTIASTDTEVTLWAPNFKRPGYGFVGWSTEPITYEFLPQFYTKLNNLISQGKVFSPNQTINSTDNQVILDEIKNNGITLYAIWLQSMGNLQNFTQATCDSMGTNTAIRALTDTRDGNTYTIAKLADGKCWMVENLRLSNTHTTTGQPVTINSTNTNNPASGFALGNPTNTSWCSSSDAACIDQSLYNTVNTQDTITNMTTPANANIYSYGNYYNWYTATAGNGTYSKDSGSTTGDICPAGWHVPTGGTNGEYSKLDIALGGTGDDSNSSTTPTGNEMSNKYRSFPNNNLYSGYVYGSSLHYRSHSGYYWSPTAVLSSRVYHLYFDSSSRVYPGTLLSSKYVGYPVRCMLGS